MAEESAVQPGDAVGFEERSYLPEPGVTSSQMIAEAKASLQSAEPPVDAAVAEAHARGLAPTAPETAADSPAAIAPLQPASRPRPIPAPPVRPRTAPPPPGVARQPAYAPRATRTCSKSRVTAGVLAILLGALGVHKFYLGYTRAGVIMASVWLAGLLLTLGVASAIIALVGLVEGFIYLAKSDDQFCREYVYGQKQWF